MKLELLLLSFLFFFVSTSSYSQVITDDCFLSAPPEISFVSNIYLSTGEADLMEWNGMSWTGSWPSANINIPPPSQRFGCRAVFIGSGSLWTAPGEWVGMRLNQPMITGQTYSFYFTYVSNGWGSDGSFSPELSSNDAPDINNDYYILNLPPAGYSWVRNNITFTADVAQNGHNWIFLKTTPLISSGVISSVCKGCADIVTEVASANNQNEPYIYPNPAGNTLNLNFNGYKGDYRWNIYNINGQSVLNSDQLNNDQQLTLDISSIERGIYMLKLVTPAKQWTKAFVRQ
jgi:hypothetical protein